ncbi:MAG: ABC transporter substrate-binding protein [Nitrosopumilus sp.]
MKSTQLLSVVLSLIMFTGISAGSAAFAESDYYYDELEEELEDFCEMTDEEQADFFSNNPDIVEYDEKLTLICDIEYEEVRYDELYDFIDAVVIETRDGNDFDDEFDELEDEYSDVIDDFEDCVEAGYPVMESFPEQCMTDDGTVFVNDEDDDDAYDDEYERDYIKDDKHRDLDDRLEYFCDMTDEEKRQFFEDHPRFEQFSDRLANFCELSEDEREDALERFADEHIRDEDWDRNVDVIFRDKLAQWCEMSDEDKKAAISKYNKSEDQVAKADRYCTLDESDRADFIAEHRDEFIAHMKDRMHDKMTDKKHDYDRFCSMASSERLAEITDLAKYDKISKWCDMTPDEREEYKMKHQDAMKDKMHDKYSNKGSGNLHDRFAMYCDMTPEDRTAKMDAMHADLPDDLREDLARYCEMSDDEQDDFRDHVMDRMDMFKDHMKDRMHDKMKFSDKSDRLKAMIKSKYDISDERHDEIRMKYEEKYGENADKKRTELKMKFDNHMLKMKYKMSDERRSMIHDRLDEMKAFKADLRERASGMTDEQKQELREEFIEKAKDLQLAWISPRTQMTAGIDAAEVECREGFSLVMKASNGVAMCLKADTALKMIDRGIVVPAN